MNQEQRLIALFRTFVEKALLPLIKQADRPTREWQRFSSLLTTDTLDLQQTELYVDSLPNLAPSFEHKELSYSSRKKEEGNEIFQANRTFGPQTSKGIVAGLRQLQVQKGFAAPNSNGKTGKGMSLGKETTRRKESFKLPLETLSSTQPVPIVLQSLNRLCSRLSEHHIRLQQLCEST